MPFILTLSHFNPCQTSLIYYINLNRWEWVVGLTRSRLNAATWYNWRNQGGPGLRRGSKNGPPLIRDWREPRAIGR